MVLVRILLALFCHWKSVAINITNNICDDDDGDDGDGGGGDGGGGGGGCGYCDTYLLQATGKPFLITCIRTCFN